MLISAAFAIFLGFQEPAPTWAGRPATDEEACGRMLDAVAWLGPRMQDSRERSMGVSELVADETARRSVGNPILDDTMMSALNAIRAESVERREDDQVAIETLMNAATYFCPGIMDAALDGRSLREGLEP